MSTVDATNVFYSATSDFKYEILFHSIEKQ